MKKKSITKSGIRRISQILFLILFFYLLFGVGASVAEDFNYSDYFFFFDPFLLIINTIATLSLTKIFLLSMIPVILTLVFGRFFCGWICPFGTINHFFSWIFEKKREKKAIINKKLLKVKYIILIILIIMALFGTNISGWFDPFSILTRSSSLALNPSTNYILDTTLKSGGKEKGLLSKTIKPIYDFSRKNIQTIKQRLYSQSVLIGLLFLLIVGLNYYKRRFYCNYICPLGAFYGFIGRFSFLNLEVVENSCKSCNICSDNCTYHGSPFKDYLKSECMVCYNCERDCPTSAIETEFGLPGKSSINSIDLSRRKIAGSIISGVFFASLSPISVTAGKKTHSFERPPGSVKESDFLDRCIRCGECMQACPTNFIQPALFETGVAGIWTPVLEPASGYCEYECNRCTQVCPTNALEKLSIKEKKAFKIGTAVIDKNRCYTYTDGYNCAVCEEHCPIPEKAIRFREVEIWNFEGKKVKVKQIYVIPDLCIGCGICENVCPRSDAPGIVNTSEEEQREFRY